MDIALESGDTAGAEVDYAVVGLDANAVDVLGSRPAKTLSGSFNRRIYGTATAAIGIGDHLLINIWEPSADGLFSTVDKKQTQIEATVDASGKIYIPYVGQIAASGLSVERVRTAIENGLLGKAVEPQVQVALSNSGGHKVSVVGDVAQPGRFDVPVSGLRLIEAVALAGGTKQQSFDAEVTIVRGNTRGTIRLDDVLRKARNNVWLAPRDTVQVRHKPRSFTAFGAVGSKNHLLFQTETLSLAEALAQSGGLNDNLADAGGVHLFRFESPTRLQRAAAAVPNRRFGGKVATIYQLDFTQPEAFFLASRFMLQDKDVIYVANAPAAEFRKFIATIVAPLLGSAQVGTNLSD